MTFTVAATTDAKTLTYQWQLDGANLDPPPVGVSGATTNTLTIECVQESNTGVYTCVVSNAPMSTTTSNAAKLTLRECSYPNVSILSVTSLSVSVVCARVCVDVCVYLLVVYSIHLHLVVLAEQTQDYQFSTSS